MLSNLSLTQLIIFIVLIRAILMPIDVFLFGWITNLWYSKKTEYTIDTMKRIINVIETMKRIWIDKEELEGDKNNESDFSSESNAGTGKQAE